MDYFSRFLRTGHPPSPKITVDHALEFNKSWNLVKNTLLHPDERQLTRGIKATDVPTHLQSMVDALVWESARTEEGETGACLEYLLKNDVLNTLVRLSEPDRPWGIQAEVLRAVQNMVVLLDEQFLVHSAVHRAILRLLRNCVGDDIQEQLDGRNKVMGAAKNAVRTRPSEYEEDLVNLLCILCSRIRTYRELLMIFFHDKHWYRSEPLFSVEEEDEDFDDDDDEYNSHPYRPQPDPSTARTPSPTPSQATITSAPASSQTKKPEYEFLLFNYLLRFVHREGQIGDFARAGLLFLMDVAMSPKDPTHRLVPDVIDKTGPGPASAQTLDPTTDAALALAEYILDGDFSDVLGAGLGAVYSLLPSKLEFRPLGATAQTNGMMVIGNTGPETEEEREQGEAARERSRALGVEDASNSDFKSRLDHFLKLLEFLQDVFRRNKADGETAELEPSMLVGSAIVQAILDAVRRVFLENILYPSILECSDVDGSAVAVMSYIEVMIRTLPDGELADLLVNFLLSEDNDEVRLRQRPFSMLNLSTNAPPQSKSGADVKQTKLRRRKSSAMALLEMEAPDSNRPTEYFTSMGRFTLKDLLLANFKSHSQPTATAALQLFHSLLARHPQVCQDRLLVVISDPYATSFPHPDLLRMEHRTSWSEGGGEDEEQFVYPGTETEDVSRKENGVSLHCQPTTTYSTHEREMDLYLTLVSRVDPSHNGDPFSTGYSHYLQDALLAVQTQPAFQLDLDPKVRLRTKHRLNVNDPILTLILDSLRRFFSNTPELNLALTGVLSTLAIHPDRSLAGWLTFVIDESQDSFRNEDEDMDFVDDGDDRSFDFRIEEKLATNSYSLPASRMDDNSRPVIHTIFHGLVSQLDRYRQLVDNFDRYLLERRQGLLFSENLTDALTLALEPNDGSLAQPSVPTPAPVPAERPKPKVISSASSIVSFLTPKKNRPKPTTTTPAAPSTPTKDASRKTTVAASPFGSHYQHTVGVTVEPFTAPLPKAGPWSPGASAKWGEEEEDVFSAGWTDKSAKKDEGQRVERREVTLSQLLDNVVILEECIKELVAIIHARRSLGIDSVRYL